MSTRIVSMEMDLGFFGKTYCPLLAKYLGDNFTQIYQQGGDPKTQPGWADNHGVFILKRNKNGHGALNSVPAFSILLMLYI